VAVRKTQKKSRTKHYNNNKNKYFVCDRGPGKVFRIVTGFQMNGLRIGSPLKAIGIASIQDGSGALQNFLYNGYLVSPGVKLGLGLVTAPSPTSSVMV